jgi:hypothetical protein
MPCTRILERIFGCRPPGNECFSPPRVREGMVDSWIPIVSVSHSVSAALFVHAQCPVVHRMFAAFDR